VAEFLKVGPRVVQDWLLSDRVPYLEVPDGPGTRRGARIPLRSLLICLPNLMRLDTELTDVVAATNSQRLTESQLRDVLGLWEI
jgi:hypothetical protein